MSLHRVKKAQGLRACGDLREPYSVIGTLASASRGRNAQREVMCPNDLLREFFLAFNLLILASLYEYILILTVI